ncbi:hypothetical protein FXV83_27365 [Bradyrhizobium hipponense]|uniref:Uncharacterized protein n=1 Tax=Bradyrhizobium hipponense TaxID=2605638 RepID=A0A5S4YGG4_9BRAD|nr:hypothetical protein FXV83_27365 [Bradyrhizobium hipponense]
MPGLVPGIHVLRGAGAAVDGRDKPGHDAVESSCHKKRHCHHAILPLFCPTEQMIVLLLPN